MEIYERVRILRKQYLKMSQEVFAEKLGVTRTVIKNIELNALARPDQKLSLFKLICSEFNVSEDWLLNGNGEMFVSNEAEYSTLIDQALSGENEFVKNVFKTFALFDAKDWEALQHMVEKYNSVADSDDILKYNEIPTAAEIEANYSPIAAEDLEKGKNIR